MKLHGYWRSSATYRVRIALALKGLEFDYEPVNLLKGEQREAAYLTINPLGLVPALETDSGAIITQSLAIIEFLEETFPTIALLPADPVVRAKARAIAATIASEAQPLMNLRIQQYLKNDLGLDEAAVGAWLNRWPGGAMAATEEMLAQTAGAWCVGDAPTIADCCLIPQMFAAARFGVDISGLPKMAEIFERAKQHPAFEKAHPLNQPDAAP